MHERPSPESDTLSLKISKLVGYGVCSIVSLMFIRNFINFPVGLAPLMLELGALSLVGLKVLRGYKFSFSPPRPSWVDATVLLSCVIIAVRHVLYFQKFYNGIYTQYYSPDLLQHISDSFVYANGHFPSMSGTILYWGFYYMASIPISFGLDPRESVRATMALLAILSPLLVYLVVQKLFGSNGMAGITALLWSGVDFTWYRMTVDLSLYPTFFGTLASMILVAACRDFLKKKIGASSIFILSIAIVTAYLSHYSVLFIVFPLAIYALLYSVEHRLPTRGLIVFGGLIIPVIMGAMLLPSLVSGTTGILLALGDSGGYIQHVTPLSLIIPVPFLADAIRFVNNDFLTVFLFGSLGFCVWRAIKYQDGRIAFLIAWFVAALSLSTIGGELWRISIVMLEPLFLMAGFTLSQILMVTIKVIKR